MAKNILVLNVDFRETRAALIEDGIIAELHVERQGRASGTLGNVYLGRVTRVLPGLQAAFIDIGQERAAFLHVEDLIHPTDFDEYLAGGRKHAQSKERRGDVRTDENQEFTDEDAPAEAVETGHRAKSPGSLAPPAGEGVAAEGAAPDAADASATTAEDDGVSDDEIPSAPPPPPALASSFALDPDASVPVLATDSAADLDDEDDDDEVIFGDADRPSTTSQSDRPTAPSLPAVAALDEEDDEDEDEDDEDDEDGDDEEVAADARDDEAGPEFPGEEDFDDDLPGFTISEPGEPVPRAATPARQSSRERERDGANRGRRRGRRGRGNKREGRGEGRSQPREGRESRESRAERGAAPGRISKSTPIREVVKEGQQIIVQVTKDPIGTKGARCSSHVSLPGRYVVYLPTVDHIGISKRIGSEKERARLRATIDSVKPPQGGLIVRTVAEGLTKKQLKQDVGYLVRLWGEIAKQHEGATAPALLMSELDLVLKVARDLFTDEVDEIVVDDRHQYDRLRHFVEMFAPERVRDVKLYEEDEPIFDAYGIENEIRRALERKVPLPSGGHLIIDQAEALTAIDVNTGRYVGKGSKDMEETILKTNLEAVQEIAYQLRFRNIGGLIILDLIDMEKSSSREKVRRRLEEALQRDKAKTSLNRISDLGLIEMTRKRTRESLGRIMHEPCFYCDGTGFLRSTETIAYEILRELRRKRSQLPGYAVVVNVHPAVADVLQNEAKEAVADAENRYMRKITVTPRKEYHLEQFDLQGR